MDWDFLKMIWSNPFIIGLYPIQLQIIISALCAGDAIKKMVTLGPTLVKIWAPKHTLKPSSAHIIAAF